MKICAYLRKGIQAVWVRNVRQTLRLLAWTRRPEWVPRANERARMSKCTVAAWAQPPGLPFLSGCSGGVSLSGSGNPILFGGYPSSVCRQVREDVPADIGPRPVFHANQHLWFEDHPFFNHSVCVVGPSFEKLVFFVGKGSGIPWT